MPKNSDFEAILYLPAEAYKIKTGKEMNYVPKFIPETFLIVKDGTVILI